MKRHNLLFALLAILILITACTKKDNLTGTNFSDSLRVEILDDQAVVTGYSFPADSLVSLTTLRRNLLVGNWQGSSAKSILRFVNLPSQSDIAEYTDIRDIYLDIVLQNSSDIERNPVTLNFYKVNAWAADPDTLEADEYELIPQATTQITSSIVSSDTVNVALPFDLIQNWQTESDSTGINILIMADDGTDGFVEIKLSTATSGSKIRFKYDDAEGEEQEFSRYAALNAFSFSHPQTELTSGIWKISNFAPQRIYVDMIPDFTLFKDEDGNTLSQEILKRVTINKAELVLFVKDDLSSFENAVGYSLAAFLVKERPAEDAVIPTRDMFTPEFISNLVTVVKNNADSVAVNITPIIQAYVSQKTFDDDTPVEPNGIVIMSNYERKDFGEMEFIHPITDAAETEKQPYIKIKYTVPFL